MIKTENVKEIEKNKISVCNVMKNNTSKVIKKMESQIPTLMQQYSDLYAAYLHSFDDIFGTCYIAEKEFFDKLGIDKKTMKAFENYSETLTNLFTPQIDAYTTFLRDYVKMRISAIDSFDRHVHVMMDSYSRILSQVNLNMDKVTRKAERNGPTNE